MKTVVNYTIAILAEIGLFALILAAGWFLTDMDALKLLAIDTMVTFAGGLTIYGILDGGKNGKRK